MVQVAIFSFLLGAVFGLRFKVLVLLPLTLAIAMAALPIAFIAHLGLVDTVADAAICALALHGGYVFGSFARFSVAAARAGRVLPRPLKAAR
jgi:hypothetical protein